MPAFALNSKYIPEFPQSPQIQIDQAGVFSIESELNTISIKRNARFVILSSGNKEFTFTNQGIVTSRARVDKMPPSAEAIRKAKRNDSPPPKDRYRHKFDYRIERSLTDNNSLNDLKYSLKVVYNFYKPESHFSQQFRELPSDDYDTIVNGWIYTVRTAFGKIVNSLPRQNRLEFILHAMERYSTVDFVKVPLLEGFDFLNEYVSTRILSRGRLLVATDRLLHSRLKNLLDPKQIGFVDEEAGTLKSVHIQAVVFRELLELEKKTSLKEQLNSSIKINSELENHFNKMFQRTAWPIDLRV